MCATAMVMPRAFSSGALSMESKERNFTFGLFFASVLVMAAVSVVLPWSMWPMVPILTCGLLRSNFSFAILCSWLLSSKCSLPRYLALHPRNDLIGDVSGHLLVLREMHRETSAPLRARAKLGGITEHLRQRHRGLDQFRGSAGLRAFQLSAAGNQ